MPDQPRELAPDSEETHTLLPIFNKISVPFTIDSNTTLLYKSVNSLSKNTPVETITEQTPKEQTEELATNSTDQPKTIVGGEGLPLHQSQQHQTLYSLSTTKMKM